MFCSLSNLSIFFCQSNLISNQESCQKIYANYREIELHRPIPIISRLIDGYHRIWGALHQSASITCFVNNIPLELSADSAVQPPSWFANQLYDGFLEAHELYGVFAIVTSEWRFITVAIFAESSSQKIKSQEFVYISHSAFPTSVWWLPFKKKHQCK